MDEADRLLDDLEYNFGEQLSTIFAALPVNRQTLLFSATLTEKLQEVSELAMKKPFFWASKDLYVDFVPLSKICLCVTFLFICGNLCENKLITFYIIKS